MRIVVTGAAGFLGANVVRRLAGESHDVTAVVRPSSAPARLDELEGRIRIAVADVRDAASVEQVIGQARPDAVVHLASSSFTAPGSGADHLAVNLRGALHVVEALRRAAPKARLVCAGTIAEYGSGSRLSENHPLEPGSDFAASKAAASVLLGAAARAWGVPVVFLRLCMPYGPWEHESRLIPSVIRSALEGRDVPLTAGTQQRDLVYVDDVVDALVLAAQRPLPPGAVFNIGSGQGRPVREIVERLLSLMGDSVKALWGTVPMRSNELMEMSADITRARRELGWAPRVSLDDGLRRSIAWWTERRAPAGSVR